MGVPQSNVQESDPKRAEEIARAARELAPEERAAYLERVCGDNRALREEAEALVDPDYVPGVDSTFRTRLVESMRETAAPTAGGGEGGGAWHRTNKPRYVLKGEVGRGGMGAVLKVYDTDLRRNLAMKVVLGQREDGALSPTHRVQVVDRFLEEAQVTGQLEHPGVVPVHELGVDGDGRMYFTMRLVRGKNFEEVIELARAEEDGWNVTRALNTLLRICETLAYAHSRRVLHRDLKPANIMIGRFGETYVMDWGAARLLDREESSDGSPTSPSGTFSVIRSDRKEQSAQGASPSATQEGALIGTPYYMPREQAAGALEEIGPHSDVYAVGGMLYQLLTGRRPYEDAERRRVMEIIAAIMQGPPTPVRELAPATPPELASICEKAMAYDWGDRYLSMLDMAEDLRAYLEGRVVSAYETGALARFQKWVGRNRALSISLAATIVLLVTALTTVVFLQGSKLKAVRAAQAHTAEARDLAEQNEQQALRNADEARREGYVASVIAAAASLRANEIREAKRLLAEAREDLRGWEWNHLALEANSSIRTMRGHEGHVLALAFHPDGRRVASSSEDGTVRLWDVVEGRQLQVLAELDDAVRSVSFSPDGSQLFAFGGWSDATMRSWDVASGTHVGTMNLPVEPSSPVAVSPDGARLAMATSGNEVHVVDASNGQPLLVLTGHEDEVHALVFTPDSTRLLTASGDGSVNLWDVAEGGTGELVRGFRGGDGAVFSVAVHPGGEEFVTGSEDGTVRGWRFDDAARSEVLLHHAAVVYGLGYDPTGERIASVSFDKTVRVFNRASSRIVTLNGHDLPIRCLAFAPDGRTLVTGGEDDLILSWDLELGEAVQVREGPEDLVACVDVSPDGRFIALGAQFGGTIELRERETGRVAGTIPAADDPVKALAFAPDGATIGAGYEEEACVRLFATDDLRELRTLYGHEASITSLSFAPDGRTIASGSTDFTVRVWSVDSGEEVHLFAEHEEPVQAVAFHPRRPLLAAAYADGAVLVWDAESGERTRLLTGHPDGAFALAWQPDGARLAVGAGDHSLWIWGDGDSPEAVLEAHDQRISSIAFSPDGRRIVTGSYDTSLRIWDALSLEPLLSLRGHESPVTSAVFTPDGAEIVSGSFDNTLRAWRTRRGP